MVVAENKQTMGQKRPRFIIIRNPGRVPPKHPTHEEMLDRRINMHVSGNRPMPPPLFEQMYCSESPGECLRRLKNSTFPDKHTGFTLTSEPTATTSSVVSRPAPSRFRRCTPVLSAAEPTTVTTTSEPTATTSSVVSHNTRSRFRQCIPVSRATGTTTVTSTTTSRESHSTYRSVRPDPVRQATPPPPSPPLAPQPRAQKPQRCIEIDHLPGGKFPRVGNRLIYDTRPETMERTSSEDYSIWKWVMKWGTGYGDAGLPWQKLREWQWRKRSACAREKIRKDKIREEMQADLERKRAESWERALQRHYRLQFAKRIRCAARLQAQAEPIEENDESDDHSTIVSGILNLASRWSDIISRKLGFRS